MKKTFHLPLLLCAVVSCLLCACSKDEEHGGGGGLEIDARPTNWVAISTGIDPQSTMTADVAVDLSTIGLTYESDKEDLMAAFVNGTCRAVAAPMEESGEPTGVFALTIKKLENDPSGTSVTLKLYSAKLRHVFTISSTFNYVAEGRYGTVSNPIKPVWQR